MIDNVLKFIISPMGFIVIPLLIMIISAFKRYNNYLDVRKIVKEQYDMLKNNRIVLIIIYVLPIIVAIGIARIKTIDVGIINNVNVVLSIFCSSCEFGSTTSPLLSFFANIKPILSSIGSNALKRLIKINKLHMIIGIYSAEQEEEESVKTGVFPSQDIKALQP